MYVCSMYVCTYVSIYGHTYNKSKVSYITDTTLDIIFLKNTIEREKSSYRFMFCIHVQIIQPTSHHSSCPLSPILIMGYEYRRIFPAGVGPDSPSRDAAN